MSTKKKSGKSQSKSTSTKVSSKTKPSKPKAKATKPTPKTSPSKRSKPKASKKATTKSWSSVSSAKKTKAPASSKKAKPSSSGSRKKTGQSVKARLSKGSVEACLSTQDRYNVGGLCACVIDTNTKEGQGRLQRLLKHLDLSKIDQVNLMRVSQGVRIPKLFADGWTERGIRQNVLESLKQFAKADDPSGKQWKADLQELGRLLGD